MSNQEAHPRFVHRARTVQATAILFLAGLFFTGCSSMDGDFNITGSWEVVFTANGDTMHQLTLVFAGTDASGEITGSLDFDGTYTAQGSQIGFVVQKEGTVIDGRPSYYETYQCEGYSRGSDEMSGTFEYTYSDTLTDTWFQRAGTWEARIL